MGKYLKYFEQASDYEDYKNGSDFLSPNVSYIEETKVVCYEPKASPSLAGDIAYWDGSKVKTISQDKWDASLGTPVGVVVVPEGFAPDGKARMLSLQWANESGENSSDYVAMKWGGYGTDTSLTNYNCVPITDNTNEFATSSNTDGYLPSDKFTETKSFIDSYAFYKYRPYIPSPYLGNEPNPAYYSEIINYNNVLADFNGKNNTDILVGLGSDYIVASAAKNYKSIGAEEIEWYLPAAGELGYIMPRLNTIQTALTKLNAAPCDGTYNCASSTENSGDFAYYVDISGGSVRYNYNNKDFVNLGVRPFAIID
jgi:hypothetical protein